MRMNCVGIPDATAENIHKAEQWVANALKAFLPAPGAPSLRLERLQELEAQTDLAEASIMFNCKNFRAGKYERKFLDDELATAEEQIRYLQKSLGDEVVPLASRGQVSNLPEIRSALGRVAGQGRQDALLGENELADQAARTLVNALVCFSTTFKDACYGQEFDPDIAVAIERQNEIEGTNVDLNPCAYRKFAVRLSPVYVLESCSVHGVGDWRFTWTIDDPPPKPTQSKIDPQGHGEFESIWSRDGVTYRSSGDMRLTRKEQRDSTGKLLERHYWMSGTVELKLVEGENRIVRLMQLTPAKKVSGKAKYEAEVQYSQKPCKDVDETPPPG
jgi:hypothetical protein